MDAATIDTSRGNTSHHGRPIARAAMVAVAAMLVLVAGCASHPAASSAPNAQPAPVFLAHVESLRPSPDHADRWYDLSRRLGNYGAFIVEKPEIMPDRAMRGAALTTEQREMLASSYQDEMRQALSTIYSVTDSPGPGVARIRSAITAVARSVNKATGARQDGGANREMEIVDSVSGERLAAVIELDIGQDEHAPGTDRPFHDARATFTHWSARFTLMLRDVERLATRP